MSRLGPWGSVNWRIWRDCSRVSGTPATVGAWRSVRAAGSSPSVGSLAPTDVASRPWLRPEPCRWESWPRWLESRSAGAHVAHVRGTTSSPAGEARSWVGLHASRTSAFGSCRASSSGSGTEAKGFPTRSCGPRSNWLAAKVPGPSKAGPSLDRLGTPQMPSLVGRSCSKTWGSAALVDRVPNGRSCDANSAKTDQRDPNLELEELRPGATSAKVLRVVVISRLRIVEAL